MQEEQAGVVSRLQQQPLDFLLDNKTYSSAAQTRQSVDPPVRRLHRHLDYIKMNDNGMKRARGCIQGSARAPRALRTDTDVSLFEAIKHRHGR